MIIPSINCSDFKRAKEHILIAKEFLPSDGWLHIDVSDGIFTPKANWGNPSELKSLALTLNIEIHLMVANPDDVIDDWLIDGVGRIIVHHSAVRDIDAVKTKMSQANVELVLAFEPSVPTEDIPNRAREISAIQILAVAPGESGQSFDSNTPFRIEFLREHLGGVRIEVDGGINLETGALAIKAGADTLVSGNYIFSASDPARAFQELNSL